MLSLYIYLRWINFFIHVQTVVKVRLPQTSSSANTWFPIYDNRGPFRKPWFLFWFKTIEQHQRCCDTCQKKCCCATSNTDLLCRKTGSKLCLMGSHTGADRAQTSGRGIDRRRGQSHNSWCILNNRLLWCRAAVGYLLQGGNAAVADW